MPCAFQALVTVKPLLKLAFGPMFVAVCSGPIRTGEWVTLEESGLSVVPLTLNRHKFAVCLSQNCKRL